jgi:hypothetical protein
MPWGLRRLHHSGQSHFVTFCCYHRRRSFTTDARCRIFESALERVRRSYRLYVYGYVVMHGACPPPAQRTATGYAGRCAEVVEARSIAALDWRFRPSCTQEAWERIQVSHRLDPIHSASYPSPRISVQFHFHDDPKNFVAQSRRHCFKTQ